MTEPRRTGGRLVIFVHYHHEEFRSLVHTPPPHSTRAHRIQTLPLLEPSSPCAPNMMVVAVASSGLLDGLITSQDRP